MRLARVNAPHPRSEKGSYPLAGRSPREAIPAREVEEVVPDPRSVRFGRPMKAVVYDRYGPPEVLRLAEVPRPEPKSDELLVRVHATTVNRTDAGLRSAELVISRAFTGLLAPKNQILGMEFSGVVEASRNGAIT